MQRRTISRVLSYLGAAVKSGQLLQGVQNGPEAIRQSGVFNLLKDHYKVKIKDHGDIIENYSQVHNQLKPTGHQDNSGFKNLEILDPTLKDLNDKIEDILQAKTQEEILLTVGGDHSIASGSIHGMLSHYEDLKVIWVDAHADILDADKTDYNGYHGTPLAHLLGVNDNSSKLKGFSWLKRRLKRENVVIIGWRQINDLEMSTLKEYGIKYYTPDHIDMYGIGQIMNKTLSYLDPHHNKNTPFHISFDIDGIDPIYASATGTTNRGGLTPREACHIVRRTAFEKKVVGMDLVQINPQLETRKRRSCWGDQYYPDEMGETVGMGADLIESLFTRGLQ